MLYSVVSITKKNEQVAVCSLSVTHTPIHTHTHTHTHTHIKAVCTSITKQIQTTVAVIYPSSTLHYSPCHIAEDVGADHHASPAPHLFPLLLQPLLQGLLQEHLQDEHATASVERQRRDTGTDRMGGVSSSKSEKEVWSVSAVCLPGPCATVARLAGLQLSLAAGQSWLDWWQWHCSRDANSAPAEPHCVPALFLSIFLLPLLLLLLLVHR